VRVRDQREYPPGSGPQVEVRDHRY
jgi:hypothetical protein